MEAMQELHLATWRCLAASRRLSKTIQSQQKQLSFPVRTTTKKATFSTARRRQLKTGKDSNTGMANHVETPQDQIRTRLIEAAKSRNIPLPPQLHDRPPPEEAPRLPRNVQALYLAPLRRPPTHGVPVCNLQLRSYSVRNLEFMADFAMRTAYYLKLPAKGPVPLPRITTRWTVPRSHFIFKKSQENWERVTVRRLIQIQDGQPEVVQRWLQFVRKWSWYGVGMKADIFEFEGLGVAARMDKNEKAIEAGVERIDWELFGRREGEGPVEMVRREMDRLGNGGPKKIASTPG